MLVELDTTHPADLLLALVFALRAFILALRCRRSELHASARQIQS